MTFLHVGVTVALALLLFVCAMETFTHGPGGFYYMTKALMWIWSPFAMAAADGNSGITLPAEAVALIWSAVVGSLSGYIAPIFLKPKIQIPLSPRTNPATLRELKTEQHNEESEQVGASADDNQ